MTVTAFHTAGRQYSVLAFIRPLALLAVLAFLAGFGGYLVLGSTNALGLKTAPQTTAAAPSPATDASAPAGDWNLPKQI